MHEHHQHSLDLQSKDIQKRLLVALWLNGGFLIIEVLAGLFSNSLSLLSDAGHMVTDVAALALAYFMKSISNRKRKGKYTYGFRRAPVLGAFGNGLSLLIMVVFIIHEGISRWQHPPQISGLSVIIVGIAGLLVNVISAYYISLGHHHGDINVKGAMLHLASDALGSLGALISGFVIYFTAWTLIDPIISFFIALLIAITAVPLIKRALMVFLEASPSVKLIETIEKSLLNHEFVKGVEDIHVWELDSGTFALTCYLITSSDESIHVLSNVSDELRKELLQKFNVVHAVLEWRCHKTPYVCE